jgi:large subunit ribosomal protein L21
MPLAVGFKKRPAFRLRQRVLSTRQVPVLMYAVIETGGKQYRVLEGDTVFVEKLDASEGEELTFDKVVAVGKDDGFVVGAPYVEGAKVEATVVKNGKGKKIMVFKYKSKKNERKRQGHRQPYTKVEIKKIDA